jgi:hypothetical protein
MALAGALDLSLDDLVEAVRKAAGKGRGKMTTEELADSQARWLVLGEVVKRAPDLAPEDRERLVELARAVILAVAVEAAEDERLRCLAAARADDERYRKEMTKADVAANPNRDRDVYYWKNLLAVSGKIAHAIEHPADRGRG